VTITVGIVDDEHLVRGGLRMLLSAEPDLEVVGEAADGEEALALVAEHDPDVLLMDIRMPRLDGLATIRRLAETSARARVIVLVGVERGQHDDAYACERRVGSDPPRGLDAVDPRHPDVHQQHVRMVTAGQFDRLLTIRRFADEFEVRGVVDHAAQPSTDQRLIVDDTDSHGHVDTPNGRRAATWKPPAGRGPTSRSP